MEQPEVSLPLSVVMTKWLVPLLAVARAEFFDGVYTLTEMAASDCTDPQGTCYEAGPAQLFFPRHSGPLSGLPQLEPRLARRSGAATASR